MLCTSSSMCTHAVRVSCGAGVDEAWLEINLGAVQSLCSVSIDWEGACASEYELQTSADGTAWTTVATAGATGAGVVATMLPCGTSSQYFRMEGVQRCTVYGYSIWTLSLYGPGSAPCSSSALPSAPSLPPAPPPLLPPSSPPAAACDTSIDLALNAEATASSGDASASSAVDGNPGTRWESSHGE